MPFEYWDLFGISSPVTVKKVAGFSYFSVALLKAKPSFVVKYNRLMISMLFFLWVWIGIQSMFNHWEGTKFSLSNLGQFNLLSCPDQYPMIIAGKKYAKLAL